MTENLKQLQEFLHSQIIPMVTENKGFLEIIRKAHNETINSNIYTYFLNCDDAIIANVFLSSLLELIKEKIRKRLNFSDHYALTEFTTDKGRIDILIKDNFKPSTIIIENKIFHHLHNSLEEYWNFIDVTDDEKVGVLLTLEPHDIPEEVHGKFVNITHWEWISRIKQELNFDDIKENSSTIYLNDFFNAIEKLSTTYTMNESAAFFFQNAQKVNLAHSAMMEGHKFMIEQYSLIARKLGLEQYGSELTWKNFWDEDKGIDTYLTVITDKIFSGEDLSYQIVLELFREDVLKADEIIEKFGNHEQFVNKDRGETKNGYCHLLVKTYHTSLEELGALAEHVVNNIQNDFGDIFIEIVEELYRNTDINKWKHNLKVS